MLLEMHNICFPLYTHTRILITSDHVSQGNVHYRLLTHDDLIAAKMTDENDAVMKHY